MLHKILLAYNAVKFIFEKEVKEGNDKPYYPLVYIHLVDCI